MSDAENRLQESEIKLAFLEKELADYRDAVDDLHAELSRLARRVKSLEAAAGAQDSPAPSQFSEEVPEVPEGPESSES